MYTKKSGRMTYKSNRRPNFKRNTSFASKGRNKGNVSQQYNKYLKLAKDTFSAGDRIQAEYYYQFTDHYYRLMLELGINIEDQESTSEIKDTSSENIVLENNKESTQIDNDKLDIENDKEPDTEKSIESIPFISDPVKKKRTGSSK
tara:strand:- start:2513 stop:2950 length:438 start_codon:yes stop_codon:yes gene_type:complete